MPDQALRIPSNIKFNRSITPLQCAKAKEKIEQVLEKFASEFSINNSCSALLSSFIQFRRSRYWPPATFSYNVLFVFFFLLRQNNGQAMISIAFFFSKMNKVTKPNIKKKINKEEME